MTAGPGIILSARDGAADRAAGFFRLVWNCNIV